MTIKIFKMLNGEEIIAKSENNINEEGLLIENPMIIGIVPNEQGEPGLSMRPYVMFGENIKGECEIRIKNDHIMFSYDPAEDILESYRKVFSPIEIPVAGNISNIRSIDS